MPIPVLSFLPSLEGSDPKVLPKERSIDRDLLVAVSPDREDFLRIKTILEIREFLKMSPSTSNGHWLYRTQKRRDITIKSNDSVCRSTFDAISPGSFAVNDTQEGDNDARPSTTINVLPTLSPKSSVIVGADGTLTTWSSQNLSSTDCLISPRLPGPTHILVVQATHSTITRPVNTGFPNVRQCKASLETIEIPINDLLFVLNVPNLKVSSATPVSVLPPRLQNELPKVRLPIPYLETFPELVVYLHTKNQAALFRSIIPEWMRDIMHPLPKTSSGIGAAGVSAGPISSNVASSEFHSTVFDMFQELAGILAVCSTSICTGSTTSFGLDTAGVPPATEPSARAPTAQKRMRVSRRSSLSVASEIALASFELRFNVKDDPLMFTATLLDALRGNLDYIGYYASELWDELLACQHIVHSAVSLRANVGWMTQKGILPKEAL